MVRVKYAAPNATAAARWLSGNTWVPAALLGAAALGPGTNLSALIRAVAPDALQRGSTGDLRAFSVRVRLVRFVVEADSLWSGMMMALPLLALCILARNHVRGIGPVPASFRKPALWIALVTAGISLVRGVGFIVWTLGGTDVIEAQIGYVPDTFLGTALGAPFLGVLWTLVMSLVVAGLVLTAWTGSAVDDGAEVDAVGDSRVTSDEAAWDVPVDPPFVDGTAPAAGPDAKPGHPDQPTVAAAPIVVLSPVEAPYVADLSAFRRPESSPPDREPVTDAGDPHGSNGFGDPERLFRRPDSRSPSP